MTTDMTQFYQVFFEEAAELLAEMETRLLGLDLNAPSIEDLNAIFRTAHSIKGGAGTFGFSDMTDLTHVLESLLDRLRKGELAVRSEMIDIFLSAGDILKDQLAGHRGDGKADPAAAAAACVELKRLAAGDAPAITPAAPAAAPAPAPMAAQPAVEPAVSTDKIYRIEFPGEGISVQVMGNLLTNLGQMGALQNLSQPAEKDAAQQCVLKLATDASEEDIWEVLAFMVDVSNLNIAVEAPASEAQPENAASEDAGYGFFQGAPSAPAATPVAAPTDEAAAKSPGRRLSDDPNVEVTRSGRRPDDKLVVSAASETSSIRVSIEKVDQLINLVGELVITQAMLAQTASQVDPVIYEKLLDGMSTLERNTRDMQESVMSIRMMPISFVFSRYPRVVRDLAAKLNKQVELKTVGESTELDRGLIEKIADPLTHLVRNSLDHGIELPEKRVAAGKPAKGTITLQASHQGGNIVIEVIDDGGGLNRDKILAKAKERGLPVKEDISDSDVWLLIFEAGFSTADVVTDVSGRGVGMDVVKRNIQGMGGQVEIDSALGVGTRISVRLPLTLAILDGLSVSVGNEMFILPLGYIIESLQPAEEDVKTVSGRGRVVQVRGEYLPVVALHEIFNLRPKVTEVHQGIVVILESEGRKTALFVDALVGQHQVVIKSLESNYRRVQGISGATIMGDGRVALIIDAAGMIAAAQNKSAQTV
ncbi:MAG: chemotaxis protein CheA [Nitrosospira sp.]|nr:chemotaxis protein CheA [Nitrosospira sp.]